MVFRYATLLAALIVLASPVHSQSTLTYVETAFDGENGVDGVNGALRTIISPDGAHVYVAGLDDRAIAVFSRDIQTGALTFVDALRAADIQGLDKPTGLAISPDGAHIYMGINVGDFQLGLLVASRNASTGLLTHVETFTDGEGGVNGIFGSYDIEVSPDGLHVYVLGSISDAIAVFSRNASTGALTFVESLAGENNGLSRPSGLSISPDGASLYLTSAGGQVGFLAVFERNAATGALTFSTSFTGFAQGLASPNDVMVSPDGAHVYTADRSSNGLGVWERNATTGALTFVEVIAEDGQNQAQEGRRVAVSPNGKTVYLTNDFGIAEFARDASAGTLTFVSAVVESSSQTRGLRWLEGIAISSDSRFLYTSSLSQSALATFTTSNGVAVEGTAPEASGAISVFPNPSASSQARVRLTMNEPGPVELALYDVTGRRLAILFDGPVGSGGEVELALPSHLAPGLYIIRAEGGVSIPPARVVVTR